MTGCWSCWRIAADRTRIYTRRDGVPVTTVQLYREYHARHVAAVEAGQPWGPVS